jgi:hypothetical protein
MTWSAALTSCQRLDSNWITYPDKWFGMTELFTCIPILDSRPWIFMTWKTCIISSLKTNFLS